MHLLAIILSVVAINFFYFEEDGGGIGKYMVNRIDFLSILLKSVQIKGIRIITSHNLSQENKLHYTII